MPWYNRDTFEKQHYSATRLPAVSIQPSQLPVEASSVSEQIYSLPSESYSQNPTMNQTQSYMDVHTSHFSSPQPYGSHGATAGGMVPYSHYQQPPPILPPGSAGYPSTPSSYSYPYSNGVTSTTQPASNSISSQVPAQILPLPGELLCHGLLLLPADLIIYSHDQSYSDSPWICQCGNSLSASRYP